MSIRLGGTASLTSPGKRTTCPFRKPARGCLAGKARSYRIHDAWGSPVGARLARENADFGGMHGKINVFLHAANRLARGGIGEKST